MALPRFRTRLPLSPSRRARPARRARAPRPRPPDAIADAYATWLAAKVDVFEVRVLAALGLRVDALVPVDWPRRVRVIASEVFPTREIDEAVRVVGRRVETRRGDAIERIARINAQAVSASVRQVETWRKENIDRIVALSEDQVRELGPVIEAATAKGLRVEDLRKDIQERFGVTRSHAELLARDQTMKLNGQLARARQEAVGVTQFIWRTSGDERVRESHAELEGETFSWADPPVVDGEAVIPGEQFQCRCTAEPIIPAGILDDET